MANDIQEKLFAREVWNGLPDHRVTYSSDTGEVTHTTGFYELIAQGKFGFGGEISPYRMIPTTDWEDRFLSLDPEAELVNEQGGGPVALGQVDVSVVLGRGGAFAVGPSVGVGHAWAMGEDGTYEANGSQTREGLITANNVYGGRMLPVNERRIVSSLWSFGLTAQKAAWLSDRNVQVSGRLQVLLTPFQLVDTEYAGVSHCEDCPVESSIISKHVVGKSVYPNITASAGPTFFGWHRLNGLGVQGGISYAPMGVGADELINRFVGFVGVSYTHHDLNEQR